MDLHGKVALVLGAIKGIGKGVTLSLADAGVKVAVNYFDWAEELEALKTDLAGTGREHLILKTNLLETKAIPGMIKKVIDRCLRPKQSPA
jgi:3-oxoacyl-[acyl-carrier protein] reductase